MGNSFSVSCDPREIFQVLDVKPSYITNLEKNIDALEEAMFRLRAKRDDLSRRVMREEYRGLRRLAKTQVWLSNVTRVEDKVNVILRHRDAQLQELCVFGFCSTNLRSSYRYGKMVVLIFKEVESLIKVMFEIVAEQPPISEEQELPIQPLIVGGEKMLEKAWNHLTDDGVGIMGLYGMGGVGKTTLLKLINNKVVSCREYDLILWIVVSKEFNMEKIQDVIAKSLGLVGEGWRQKDKREKALDIHRCLERKRFALFLDDIWEKVDLAEIGVPFPTKQNRCKVVLTTRSREVCERMGTDYIMEITCLNDHDAFELFKRKVGKRSLAEILELAKIIVKKCRGLPLALNVIGESMSGKTTIQEWQHVIDILNSDDSTEFSGVDDIILPILKNSYNNLGKQKGKSYDDNLKKDTKNDNIKDEDLLSFLLYCASLPKGYILRKDQLVNYWLYKGDIDESGGIEKAENKGYEIIGSLVRKSLLLEETNSLSSLDVNYVRMHDLVRNMVIESNPRREREACPSVKLPKMPKVENQTNVMRRMPCMKKKNFDHQASDNECSELRSLLLRKKFIANIDGEIFKFMPELRVLDLSHNQYLSELPDGISEARFLQYLNLSYTGIRHLPKGLQRLQMLTHLDLDETRRLWSIAGVSSLRSLKVLKLVCSGISLDLDTVKELEQLRSLETLTTGFYLPTYLKNFLGSHRLTLLTRSLKIHKLHQASIISLPTTMGKLHDFAIWECRISRVEMERKGIKSNLSRFFNLSSVLIHNCKGLEELTFLIFAPNLKRLEVEGADELEDIINDERARKNLGVEAADEVEDITHNERAREDLGGEGTTEIEAITNEGRDLEGEEEESEIIPFRKLIYLKLVSLPKLKSIYMKPLPFPILQIMEIQRCPMLKKLPLDSQSGKSSGNDGLIIQYGEEEWINDVEWEDEATKTRFLSTRKFKAQSTSKSSPMPPASSRVDHVNGHKSAARVLGMNQVPGKHSDYNNHHQYHFQKPLTANDVSPAPIHESNLRIAYQGVPGAYSEAAARKAYPNCQAIPCDQFEVAFQAVELCKADRAVLPLENSLGGFIHRNYDLLLRRRLHIVGEVQLPVHYCLLALPGVRKESLTRVISHPQGLDQCKHTLKKLGLNVAREAVDDTAGAAEFIAANDLRDAAAIASARAAEIYGLEILEDGIQDEANNVTRFVMVAREPIIPRTDRPFKTSIVFAHEKGTSVLSKVLSAFAGRDIRVTKIESRPDHNRPIRIIDDLNVGMAKHFEDMFYVDFEASMAEERAQNVLAEVKEFTSFLRVLGSYPMDVMT